MHLIVMIVILRMLLLVLVLAGRGGPVPLQDALRAVFGEFRHVTLVVRIGVPEARSPTKRRGQQVHRAGVAGMVMAPRLQVVLVLVVQIVVIIAFTGALLPGDLSRTFVGAIHHSRIGDHHHARRHRRHRTLTAAKGREGRSRGGVTMGVIRGRAVPWGGSCPHR